VCVLAKHFSLRNLDLAEDVVQATLLEALRAWQTRGVPDNPAAWVRQVAKNKLLDHLRHERVISQKADQLAELEGAKDTIDDGFLDSEIEDGQLRMMFVCCVPELEAVDRLALALKTLCGFNFVEIGRALQLNPETVKKRLQRAKAHLQEFNLALDVPLPHELERRLAGVHAVLYLLFNEGYLSTANDQTIRLDLCDEAIRLATLLADHPRYHRPSSDALLALFLFHRARFDSRIDDAGRIVLLGDQDRRTWDKSVMNMAFDRLDRAARGTRLSRYHVEAGVAYEHGRASSLATTNWDRIIQLYDLLINFEPTPTLQLNRAIALAERDGPSAGLNAMQAEQLEASLGQHHLYHATVGELLRRLGESSLAKEAFQRALNCSPSPAEKLLLSQKINTV
jgi:RNA polymerase sigma factor (sigma-70 family)